MDYSRITFPVQAGGIDAPWSIISIKLKHREESRKYDAQLNSFYEMQGVWK